MVVSTYEQQSMEVAGAYDGEGAFDYLSDSIIPSPVPSFSVLHTENGCVKSRV